MKSDLFSNDAKRELEQHKSREKINCIKSSYILKKVFNNLPKKRLLEIILNNNKLKSRLNIIIDDYKIFSAKYSSIEIEIIPAKNKYGKFIKILEENDRPHYHIYFNDNKKEEIKKTFFTKDDYVSKINIIIDHKVKSMSNLFYYCECVESIDFKKFSRTNIENMESIFSGCLLLKEINLDKFNTNNVTNMNYMFSGCSALTKVNLDNFNTENVKYMNSMFSGCSSLKEINISNFNTDNVIKMNSMFCGCASLEELNLSNFNTENVYDMNYMFYRCLSLKKLTLCNIKDIVKTKNMLSRCSDELEIRDRFGNVIDKKLYVKEFEYWF